MAAKRNQPKRENVASVGGQTPPRTKKMSRKSKRSPILRFFGALFYLLFLSLVVIGSTLAGWLSRSEVIKEAIPVFLVKEPASVFEKDVMTLLILGCDEDLYYGGTQVLKGAARSDMMLVARLDFANKRITGVSIPRDTRCQLPGDRARKMNAYHAIAKRGQEAKLTQTAVEHLLPGVKIDRVLEINYESFVDLVDLIGGVTVDVDKHLKYTDKAGGLFIDIPAGLQHLNGYDAMCFVRFRKDAGSDFVRQERQKKLLVALKNQVVQNWTLLPTVAEFGAKAMGGLTGAEVAALAKFGRSVPPSDIKLSQLPTKPGRGSFLELDESKAAKVLKESYLIKGNSLNGKTEATMKSSRRSSRA